MRQLALAVFLTTLAAPCVEAGDFEMAGMKAKVPANWKEENPSSNMRIGQFKIPKVEGDPEDAEIAVFHFASGSGSAQDNMKRQLAKFKPQQGKTEPENKTGKIKVGQTDATYQEIKGTFLSKFPPFAPNAKITEKPDFMELYVIFTTNSGEYYVMLLGPAKTVEKNKKEFEDWLANFK